ncbi:Mpv17/PMP22 family protein [Anaerosolibacter sp.]|uniref:Mpv17/PMP22 family protein n=2 Tax=Anaerosolibacter sp. TaxID=1872527 RepID=UPI0039F0AB7F
MKKGDFLWLLSLLAVSAILLSPATHGVFIATTKAHPYLMGFIKVAILATMGELLAIRIVVGKWTQPVGLFWRMVIWGFFGMAFAVAFPIFDAGVRGAIGAGLISDFGGSKLATAFFISTFMNLIFAPTFMGLHRITDTYIELCDGKVGNLSKVSIHQVVEHIDWKILVSFVYAKTIPIFWIPAHTITFMLPPEYRVLMSAFLSIALGGILSFVKKKGQPAGNR